MIFYLQRRYREALADFQAFLRLAPPDDPQIKDVKSMIHRIRALLN
jgi:cytochrome c-type biogenesis protein CcmH/NrfG